ncbi:hypothetical protein [Microbacterium testaceum]|uniref:hypothetical protein n=1 Tax=Microbacterium testaceum TaxID=2033 RepID=UPI000B1EFDC2|nr:hypothetical protein [Microbacterium testaceum]
MAPIAHRVHDEKALELGAEIRRRLEMLNSVADLYDTASSVEALPHSQLSADDRATAWLQLSHGVRSYMNLAADMARALSRILLVQGALQVPMHAHFPLLRSLIEASAQTLWVLQPDQHSERVQRSLRARLTEQKWDADLYKEVLRSAELYGASTDDELSAGTAQIEDRDTELRAKVRALSDAAGLDWGTTSSGLPATATILRRVGGIEDVPGEFATSIWRLISGLTHPSASRTTHYSHLEILRESREGVVSARLTASMEWTLHALVVALGLFASAVSIYRIRRTKPHGA